MNRGECGPVLELACLMDLLPIRTLKLTKATVSMGFSICNTKLMLDLERGFEMFINNNEVKSRKGKLHCIPEFMYV